MEIGDSIKNPMPELVLEEKIRGKMRTELLKYINSRVDPQPEKKQIMNIVAARGQTGLTFSRLPEILDMLSLSLRDYYRMVGVEIVFPNEKFQEVYEICEKLSDDTLDRIYNTLVELTPSWWSEFPSIMPSERTYQYFNHILAQEQMSYKNELGPGILTQAYSNKVAGIYPEKYPEISVKWGISLHWLLGFDAHFPVYGKNPKIDVILDGYSFLAESKRDLFLETLYLVLEEERRKEEDNL